MDTKSELHMWSQMVSFKNTSERFAFGLCGSPCGVSFSGNPQSPELRTKEVKPRHPEFTGWRAEQANHSHQEACWGAHAHDHHGSSHMQKRRGSLGGHFSVWQNGTTHSFMGEESFRRGGGRRVQWKGPKPQENQPCNQSEGISWEHTLTSWLQLPLCHLHWNLCYALAEKPCDREQHWRAVR